MDQKGRTKMKVKAMLAVAALSCAPLGTAGNKEEYPNDKIAELVIENWM